MYNMKAKYQQWIIQSTDTFSKTNFILAETRTKTSLARRT